MHDTVCARNVERFQALGDEGQMFDLCIGSGSSAVATENDSDAARPQSTPIYCIITLWKHSEIIACTNNTCPVWKVVFGEQCNVK